MNPPLDNGAGSGNPLMDAIASKSAEDDLRKDKHVGETLATVLSGEQDRIAGMTLRPLRAATAAIIMQADLGFMSNKPMQSGVGEAMLECARFLVLVDANRPLMDAMALAKDKASLDKEALTLLDTISVAEASALFTQVTAYVHKHSITKVEAVPEKAGKGKAGVASKKDQRARSGS